MDIFKQLGEILRPEEQTDNKYLLVKKDFLNLIKGDKIEITTDFLSSHSKSSFDFIIRSRK